jgi:4-hydroxy-tetrahydrodipicolinate synthase
MPVHLEGIVVPLLSPFTRQGDELDVTALRRLVDRVIDAGAHAVIANAGTSEYYHLDEAERLTEAEVVVDQVRGRVPVLVGAGAQSTRASVRWAKHAESIGANGLLMTPTTYGPVPVTATLRHFVTVSEAVSIPIMLYNNPFVCGVLLGPDDLEQVVTHANVPWIKLTTQHPEHVPGILDRVGDRAVVFEGVDNLAFASMAMGSVGWVAGPGNAITELAVELWRLVRVARDLAAAQVLHRRLAPLLDFLWDEGVYCSALKEICGLRGYELGAVRSPFDELDDAKRAKVHQFARDLALVAEAGRAGVQI